MDNFIEECFKKLMRTEYERRTSVGFTKNISLTGHAKVPDDVREHGMTISKAKGMRALSGNLMGRTVWPSFIHEQQLKYVARDMFCYYFPPDSPNASILKRLAFSKINKTRYEKLKKKVRTDYVNKTLASFYKRNEKINWWNVFAQLPMWCVSVEDEIKVIYRLALALKDAMSIAGMKSLPMEYRTDTVMNIIRHMRRTEDLSGFPILADALDDVGFSNTVQGELITNDYRSPDTVHTFGSWIFKTTGNLEFTGGSNDSGTDKADPEISPEESESP